MDSEKIKNEGVKLLEEFSKALEGASDSSETHYVVDLKNVWRKDGAPNHQKEFGEKFKKLAPKTKDGFIVCEKGV